MQLMEPEDIPDLFWINKKHARVFAFDIDDKSIELGKELGKTYNKDSFNAYVSRFSDLPKHFNKLGIYENILDGFLIDCGVSDLQMNDHSKGFSAKGPIDLRMDPQRLHYLKTGIEVLKTVSHAELLRLLIDNGNLNEKAHLILYEILLDSVKFSKERKCLFLTMEKAYEWESKRTTFLLESTITALRIFINDEINQLNLVLRIASHYLKPGGFLIVIVKNEVEEYALQKTLIELGLNKCNNSFPKDLKTYGMKKMTEKPYELGIMDKILHPRVKNAKMFTISKVG
ncbi:unnamed protein product [Lepeophtheirus salmonis]|uniref:(salmon louse) hypothetical protein n=1 Tax=Lepeophtheirus salmonis TaxID=72036 RepID=A0A7R8CUD6_LEPSM|nr:unnamed protein product [Lepeophtheirus salmonis]CAF2935396.1 unnamed protein product [Lepeophtheirus salmonis]